MMLSRVLKWCIKQISRFIVCVCGMLFAVMGITGHITLMPENSILLMVILYMFIFASLTMFISGSEKYPRSEQQAN